ncbi:hypothetical protein ACFOVU_13940 [Nocardiopsis sediminis]|uniref:TPM domain-containing protein n=1 Tax=Nocardiopsis sediminis TaxID=1778267 RepID=A0ABV8FNX3_9ACTN
MPTRPLALPSSARFRYPWPQSLVRGLRILAVMACATGIVGGTVVPAGSAAAADTVSPAERIAGELRESPVYVDPSIESALPENARIELAEQIAQTGKPVYVVVVPLVAGDPWNGEPDQLLGAVHDRLGEDGSYLTAELGGTPWITGTDFGTGREHQAHEAAMAVSLDADRDAPLSALFSDTVELIDTGTGDAAYERASEALDQSLWYDSAAPDATAPGPGVAPWLAAGAAVLVAAAAVGGLLLYRRRTPAVPRLVAFDNADDARLARLRAEVERELVEVAERLGAFTLAEDAPQAAEAAEQYRTALDAQHAAGKALDTAHGMADLAGARVLLHMSEDALRAAEARQQGRRPPAARRHCYFDPLHATDTRPLNWRALGSSRKVRVHACADCTAAVRGHRAPVALPDLRGGEQVAYYEVPADESVWSATGYGSLSDDLVQRVLRGDLRHG